MRETLVVVAFLPFLYYATLDGIFHFRGRRVSLSEHVIHVVIGLSLALVFAACLGREVYGDNVFFPGFQG